MEAFVRNIKVGKVEVVGPIKIGEIENVEQFLNDLLQRIRVLEQRP